MARPISIKLQLGGFAQACRKLQADCQAAIKAAPKAIEKELEHVGKLWEAGAKLRVPWDTGDLQHSIEHDVEELDEGRHVLAVGSNVEYAVYMEFGTANWAHGAVKALGRGEVITDAQAIKTWKALEEGGRKPGPEQEQGPWLRPAFWAMGSEPQDAFDRAAAAILRRLS